MNFVAFSSHFERIGSEQSVNCCVIYNIVDEVVDVESVVGIVADGGVVDGYVVVAEGVVVDEGVVADGSAVADGSVVAVDDDAVEGTGEQVADVVAVSKTMKSNAVGFVGVAKRPGGSVVAGAVVAVGDTDGLQRMSQVDACSIGCCPIPGQNE